MRFVPVQQMPFHHRKKASQQDTQQPRDQDVCVHDGVGGGAGVFRGQDPLAEAAAAADQLGDDVHDQGDGHRHPHSSGDERGGAGQDYHEKSPYAPHL
jgi:hypothetical protein